MRLVVRVARRVVRMSSHLTYRYLHRRSVKWQDSASVVSFTFDDFPKSAVQAGAHILEDLGAVGTYYVSLGKMDEEGMFDAQDIEGLIDRGHELGCHTYSHLNAAEQNAASLLADARRNSEALRKLVPGASFENFAYPFGSAPVRAMKSLGREYGSCRGIRPGVNRGEFDLNHLRAVRLYSRFVDTDHLCRLLMDLKARPGWLIFYTHDVAVDPSRFGCTPAQLREVTRRAHRAGMSILSVRSALLRLESRPGRPPSDPQRS